MGQIKAGNNVGLGHPIICQTSAQTARTACLKVNFFALDVLIWQESRTKMGNRAGYAPSIRAAISLTTLAQTMAVRPEASRAGLYSTTSAPIIRPRNDCRAFIASRTDMPPGSQCDTPGAKAGSNTSISNET